jgi:hypothetical protein
VGRSGAFVGGEMLQRSSVPLCRSYSKVRRRGKVRHTGIEIGATGEWSSPQGGHGGGSNSRGGSASSD